MQEKELINRIKELRDIKPNPDWVFSLKNSILPEERYTFDFSVFFKPALATVCALFILVSLFSFTNKALPGDLLYPVKRLAEKGHTYLLAEKDKSQASLKLVDRRLEELNKIVASNQSSKLSQAISEFQASTNQAAQDFKSSEVVTSQMIEDMLKLVKDKQNVEETLAIRIDSGLDPIYKDMVEYLIADFKTRTLTEEQNVILEKMEELVQQEDYGQALELYLINQ